jgi:hypothetical protein
MMTAMRHVLISALLALGWASSASAATITRYVNTASSGGDGTTNATSGVNAAYATCQAWETAEQTDLDTANNLMEVHFEGSAADTATCTINGWTTSATDYILMVVDQSVRHAGSWSTSHYRLSVANATALTINEDYVRVEGFQIEKTAVSANDQVGILISAVGTSDIRISNTIIRHASGGANRQAGVQVADAQATVYIWNLIDYGHPNIDTAGNSSVSVEVSGATVSIYSSTLIGGGRSISHATGTTVTCKNVYAHASATGGVAYEGTGTLTQTDCAASDTSSDEAGLDSIAYDTTQFTNVTGGSEDLHLPAGSALLDVGTDTSGEGAPLNFTNDIDGATRVSQGAAWDIGADERAVAGGTPAADCIRLLLLGVVGSCRE